jgi:peptidoglycan/LPS O-acetylase OafA/YrhL
MILSDTAQQRSAKSLLQAQATGDSYRADIDGMRAIAVLSVLLFHAGFKAFQGGFTGVDVFFVISGFLIGGHVYGEILSGRFTFAAFYRRRAKRILPALYVVICVVLATGALLLSPGELRRAATESIATLLCGSNVFFWKITDYFAVASHERTLLMTWSLGVEEQFYLAMPLLLIGALRFRVRLVPLLAGLSALSFCIACFQVANLPASAFYLLPARAWELFGGVHLALVTASKSRITSLSQRTHNLMGAVGLVLVVLPIFFLTPVAPFPGIGALPSVLGTVLVLSATRAWTNQKLLSASPFRFVGRISYSLYLWHWPLLTFTRLVLGTKPSQLQATAILAVSFLLATAGYYWIEQPLRNSPTPQRRLLLRYAGVTAILFSVCFGVRITYGLAFRAPAVAAMEERLDRVAEDSCLVRDSITHPNTSAECFENTGRPAVALWGDSHAASMAPAFRPKAHQAGYDFVEISKAACPPLLNAGRYFQRIPELVKECIAFNDAALQRLQTDPRIQLVILGSYWNISLVEPYVQQTGWIVTKDTSPAPMPSLEVSRHLLATTLLGSIRALETSGKQVFVAQDVPTFSVEPLWHGRTASLPFRNRIITWLRPNQPVDSGADVELNQSADTMAREIVADASRSTGCGLIDLEQSLCTSVAACRYRDGVNIFYRDNQHVTLAGAQAALRGFNFGAPRSESRQITAQSK